MCYIYLAPTLEPFLIAANMQWVALNFKPSYETKWNVSWLIFSSLITAIIEWTLTQDKLLVCSLDISTNSETIFNCKKHAMSAVDEWFWTLEVNKEI